MTSNHLSQPGIYEVVNTISGSRYVGSAVCIGQRWKSHRSALRNQKKAPPKLQRAWDKYGEAAFDFRVLEFCGRDVLLAREQFYIDTLAPKYNTRGVAASNLGVKWSAETNAKKATFGQVYTAHGVTGPLCELARHFNLEYNTLRYRLKRGWGIDDAVSAPLMSSRDRGIKSAARKKAAGVPLGRAPYLEFHGVRGTIKSLAAEFGAVSYYAVKRRIGLGWSLEEALLTPKRTR